MRRKKEPSVFQNAYRSVLDWADSSEDVDRTLSYYTRQQVSFLDWKLGCTFCVIQVVIAAFLVGYVLIYKEGYMKFEQAKGLIVTHVSGDAVAVSSGKPGTRYFSSQELTFPGMENGNVFIATRQVVHKQERKVCEDPTTPCITNTDCTFGGDGICTENGYCKERSWCNVESEPEIYSMKSDVLQIWTRSSIQYLNLAPETIFSTDAEGGPSSEYVFSVRELLKMCEPIPINYEEVAELGAVIEVGFRWDCNVKPALKKALKKKGPTCVPKLRVRRVDTILDPDNIGFSFNYATYMSEELREQYEVRGIRFLFSANGTGKKISMAATIMTVSTSGTLLSIAIVIADLLLTRLFSNRRKYCARKFELTPDFSKFMEEQEEKQKMRCTKAQIDAREEEVLRKEEEWLVKFQEEG